jgi:hypothetical protein
MSIYLWNGSQTGSTDPSQASNWLVYNGASLVATPSVPPPDSTIELNSGTIAGPNTTLTGDTLTFGGGGALLDLTGDSTLASGTTLSFAATSVTDTLEVGGTLDNEDRISADNTGDTLDVTLDAGATLQNQSYIQATGGGAIEITGGGTLDTGGPVFALGGNVTIGVTLGNSNGDLIVGNGSTLAVDTSTSGSLTVLFTDGTPDTTLKVGEGSEFGARILGFEAGDSIDLVDAGNLSVVGVSNSAVTLTGGIVLHFPGAGLSTGDITTASDGAGGTVLTVDTADAVWAAGAVSGDWSTAVHWSTAAQPGTATNVLIDTLGSTGYTVTADNAVAGSVVLAAPAGTLAIEGTFNVKHAILGVAGLIDVTASADVIAPVLQQRGGGSTLEMDAGTILALTGSPSNGSNGVAGLDVEGAAAFTGATLADSGNVLVGNVNNANLLATNGKVTDTYTSIGGLSGGSGTLTIEGGTWSDSGGDTSTAYSGDMLVGGGEYTGSGALGGGGTGFLTLTDSATLDESGSAILAVTMGSAGTAEVEDGATWEIAGNLTVGQQGMIGQVQVQNGSATGGTVTVGGTIYVGSASSGTTGVLDVSGTSDVSAAQLTLSGNATVNVSDVALLKLGAGKVTALSGIDVTAGGILDGGGNVTVAGTLTNNGTIMADTGQRLDINGTIGGIGVLALGSHATLDLMTSSQHSNDVTFEGGGASTLMLAAAGVGEITGFAATDTIDLTAVAYNAGNIPSYNANTGTLTVGRVNLDIGGPYTVQFVASADANGGTDIVYPCFAAGTRILTECGEVAVESLRTGDRVLTLLRDRLVPVQWIGQRHVDCRHHPRPHDVWPVRVRAHAFGRGLPHRSLVLSPDHAVFVDDVLIPVRYLVNGATIVQEPADEVTWFHVELDRHDVLLAEGLPAESYLDTGNRSAFANGGKVVMAHPDFARRVWETQSCAPLVLSGPALAAVKSRLLLQAEAHGHAMTEDPGLQVIAGGRVVPPQRVSSAPLPGGLRRLTWELTLPERTRRVRIASRAFVPAELYADREDHRRLGVAVQSMLLDGEPVPATALLTGWLPMEDEWQWTDGMATLATGGARRLCLSVLLRVGRYWSGPLAPKAGARLMSGFQRPTAFGGSRAQPSP